MHSTLKPEEKMEMHSDYFLQAAANLGLWGGGDVGTGLRVGQLVLLS